MRTLKNIFLALILVSLFPLASFASDREILREENGKKCIDLSAAYEEIKNTSQAITGQEQSLDSIKKAQSLATLSNLYSFFMGDKSFCIKDEVAASNVSSLKSNGLLGMVDKGNSDLLAMYPSFSVVEHLAKEFVPGYKGNNATLAQSEMSEGELREAEESATEDSERRYRQLDEKLSKGDTTGKDLRDLEDNLSKAEEAERNAPAPDSAGYKYLKDSLKLDKLWGQSRNIAYMFFVVAMIVIGFMIMFRNKIGGQVLVSVSNSIPQLIICLVLVTFSFAIAGLMLDIGRASMKVVERVFITAQKGAGDDSPAVMNIKGIGRLNDQLMYSFNPFDMIKNKLQEVPLIGGALGKTVDFATGWKEKSGGAGTGILWTRMAGNLFGWYFGLKAVRQNEVIDGDVGGAAGGSFLAYGEANWSLELTGAIEAAKDFLFAKKGETVILGAFFLILLFIVVCLYASVKLFITIITTYIKIFVNVVLGPLQIASGALPGNFSAVSNWFKSLAANILVFPAIIAILNLFNYIGSNMDPGKFNFFGNKGVFWPGALLSIRGIFMFAGYLFAANAPALVNGFLKVGENKTMSAVGDTVKRTAGKIPMIGGMFNK